MNKILVIGEVLVEIVALEKGYGFRSPMNLVGPFPSGAPAIFHRPSRKTVLSQTGSEPTAGIGIRDFLPCFLANRVLVR